MQVPDKLAQAISDRRAKRWLKKHPAADMALRTHAEAHAEFHNESHTLPPGASLALQLGMNLTPPGVRAKACKQFLKMHSFPGLNTVHLIAAAHQCDESAALLTREFTGLQLSDKRAKDVATYVRRTYLDPLLKCGECRHDQ